MKQILTILAVLVCYVVHGQQLSVYEGKTVVANKVVFKYATNNLKSASNYSMEISKQKFLLYLKKIGVESVVQKFPDAVPAYCEEGVDITKIHEFEIPSEVSLSEVLETMRGMDCVEYAEPLYVGDLFYSPNDTEFMNGNLWHLNTCKVLDAWDVEQGDSTVVIAIVDGGVDIIQTDLINKIAYNYDDPINGLDDDGDGYTDNYRGWDLGNNDNNPANSSGIEHGTYVAGIAAGEVDNEFGTAGVGFKSRILPIKVCQEGSSMVTLGYEGIVYAANHGCKVINCSWGDPGGSDYGSDIVRYATFNCNALVVAAAGNSAATELYYPASYPYVLSVGGTVAGDYIWYDSNTKGSQYNHSVDLCAPAKNYYSIANNDKTISMSGGGTSFATPIVSGAAALLWSKYPHYSAYQIGEQLRVTSDNIYTLNYETAYQDMLGYGRLNVYQALTDVTKPSLRIKDCRTENNSGQPYSFAKDTIDMYVTIKNYLNDAKNVSITFSSVNALSSVVIADTVFETIGANEEVTCKFSFRLSNTPPVGYELDFRLGMTADGGYSDYEYTTVLLNQYYYDFAIGNIQTTATCDGSVGVYSPSMAQNGFRYNDYDNCLFQGGVILAENQDLIYSRTHKTADYTPLVLPTVLQSDTCDVLVYSQYSTANYDMNQYIYGWEDTDAVIYEYRIGNRRDSALYDLRFGMFLDWDFFTSTYNKIWYEDTLQLTIVSSVEPRTFYVGVMPLDYRTSGLYAFDVATDKIYYKDGFNNTELWYALTHEQHEAGVNSVYGAEVVAFNYSKIDTLDAGDTASVRYAMIAAECIEDLYSTAYRLKQTYNPNPIVPDTSEISPVFDTQIEPIRLYKEYGSYHVAYQKSKSEIIVSLYSLDGTCHFMERLSPENQSGKFDIPQNIHNLEIVTINREGKIISFKIIQE